MIRSLLALLGVLVSCSVLAQVQILRLESSSAAYPLSNRIAKDLKGDAKIAVSESGSAEALRRLCAGEAELATTSRPILKSELAHCLRSGRTFVEAPIAFDAVVVVVNPRNSFVESLSLDELRKAWAIEGQSRVRRWNQINPAYPDLPLKLYAPESRAERGNYFNDAVLGSGREARRDVTSSVDDDIIVQAVARDANALGYVPLSYYIGNRNKLKGVPIVGRAGGRAVAPSHDSIASGRYQPLSRPLFLYASVKALERAEVASFVDRYLQEVPGIARELGYVPLADATYQLAKSRVRNRTAGSLWGGAAPVGLTLDALHERIAAL